MRPKLIAFMNSFSHGKSGGDMVFIEISKRFKKYDKLVITSMLGRRLCQESGLKAHYQITTTENEFNNVIWIYLKRIIKAFTLKLNVGKQDIFLGTSDFLPDVLPIFFLKLLNNKNKWVQHIFHLIPPSRKIPYWCQKISLFLIKKDADSVIVDNNLLKNELEKIGFNPQKIFVNHPGINLSFLKSVKHNLSPKYDGIFMAQLRSSKGILDLLKIWKLVVMKKPKAKLGIIGKGDKQMIKKIKKDINDAGLQKNIYLLGYIKDKKTSTIIANSRIFVFPSHEEGFGIAALEAQALGLPIVAWNLPVFSEVFPQGMIQVPIGRMEKFADEVLNLLEDIPTYRRISKSAVENANRYDWGETAKRELEIINK